MSNIKQIGNTSYHNTQIAPNNNKIEAPKNPRHQFDNNIQTIQDILKSEGSNSNIDWKEKFKNK